MWLVRRTYEPCDQTISLESLPVEILDPILVEAAQFCRHNYDPSILIGENSSWLRIMRSKKGLPLICKALHWSGMKALYSDIVLWRMGQIVALANTLRLPDIGSPLSLAIRHISMVSCPIVDSCTDLVRGDIAWIMSNCPMIRSFAYHIHPSFPLIDMPASGGSEQFGGMLNPSWFFYDESGGREPLLSHDGCSHRLRHLDLSIDLRLEKALQGLHIVLQHASALSTLRLTQCRSAQPEIFQARADTPTPNTTLYLPSLTELKIDVAGHGYLQQYIYARWDMPRLERLTIRLDDSGSGNDAPLLLRRFGAHLVYVHLLCGLRAADGNACRNILSELDATCPVIEHLVLPLLPHSKFGFPSKFVVRSRTLRWLDMWLSSRHLSRLADVLPYAEWGPGVAREAFVHPRSDVPEMRAVRMLLAQWRVRWFTPLPSVTGDVPEVCGPEVAADRPLDAGEYVVHRISTQWWVQTAQIVLPYDAEEMEDVVAMIVRQRGGSPEELTMMPQLLDEFFGWEFDRTELRGAAP